MNITSMKIRFLDGGLASGKLVLALELGKGGFKVPPHVLLEGVLRHVIGGGVKSRLVLLTGDVASPENLDAEGFIIGLGAQGLIPILETPGYEIPSWAGLIPTRIARITEEPWLKFAASEIVYTMTSPDAEPEIDPSLHGGSSFVLTPRSNVKAAEILGFMTRSRWPWRIATRPVSLPYVDLTPSLAVMEKENPL